MDGTVSDATLTTGITLANSFVGKVATDDTQNTSDNNGMADFIMDVDSVFDWPHFDNAYRAWGKDGLAVFPDAGQQNQWTIGKGRIWDWSLSVSDAVVRDVLVLPTGDDTLTHTWSGTPIPTTDVGCNLIVAGSTYNGSACDTTYLHNAAEIPGDGIGNDNGLCESDETCLYAPNIGSYQGHGELISAGAFTPGALTGINLMRFDSNGR
jgi:hypothetical protein